MANGVGGSNGGQVKMIVWIVGVGAAGGFIGWLLQEATGGHLLPWPAYAAIPAALLLGAGAAGIGVYVLANTDLQQVGRAVFFALLCGVFFKPVWQAGSDFIGGAFAQSKATSTAGELNSSARDLHKAVTSAPEQQVQSAVQQTGQKTTDLIQQTADVKDAELKSKLEKKSAEAVETIAAAAPKAPDASVDSLERIGQVAKKTNQNAITVNVLSSLHQIETSSTDPRVVAKAREAANQLRKP
jgi:hypothetical protein